MNLLIVDDEWYAVKGLSEGVDWADSGIGQVFTAFSVPAAKELVQSNEVNVVLLDIEMPGQNGLLLARWLQETHPNIKILFLTGHANFDYAKEALRARAFDYIMKPADHQLLKARVSAAVQEALSEREREGFAARWKDHIAKMQAFLPEQMRVFWRNVLDNGLSRELIASWLTAHEVQLQAPGLVLPVALWADEYEGVATPQDEDLASFVLSDLLNQELLPLFGGCLLKDQDLENLLLLYTWPEDVERRLRQAFAGLSAKLRCRLSFRIGESASPETLWWSVRRMKLEQLKLSPSPARSISYDWEDMLLRLPAETLKAQADTLLEELERQGDQAGRRVLFYQLKAAALSLARQYGFSAQAYSRIDVEEGLWERPQDFAGFVHGLLDLCCLELTLSPTSDNASIAKAQAFVRTHLGQELNRDVIAAHVYLHPVYLSRLFKRETGVSLSDYITQERVAAAKALLQNPEVKVSAVAQKVGYPQLSHFSRVFRRCVGLSPHEYQRQVATASGQVQTPPAT